MQRPLNASYAWKMLKKTIALFTLFFTFQWGNCQHSTQCFTRPEDMNQDNVISDGGFIESYCFYYISRADVISATVKHTDPEGNHTIFCTGAEGNSGKPCTTEPRITLRYGDVVCGVDVRNSNPEDTGTWFVTCTLRRDSGSTFVRNLKHK